MATVYSLVCWGGRTGKTVTLTDAGDIVNSIRHGLRDGTPVQFASGTMPSGMALDTTYYVKSTDVNAFTLYTTDALTTQATWTGAGTGPFVLKSKTMLDYFAANSGRWGAAGAERCYDGIVSWSAARVGAASKNDREVCEIGQAFTEIVGYSISVEIPCASTLITTKVSEVFSEAFHRGDDSAGYSIYYTNSTGGILSATKYRVTVEGIVVIAASATGISGGAIGVSSLGGVISCIVKCLGTASGTGLSAIPFGRLEDNICIGFSVGIYINQYTYDAYVCNNVVSGCNYGVRTIYDTTGSLYGTYLNNIFRHNVKNWGIPTPAGGITGDRNCGETGDTNTPWTTSGGTSFLVTDADFIAPEINNFRLASTSQLIDAGLAYYDMAMVDVAGNERINYNNGGSEAVDIGCYEFDNGFGPHPASHALTLTNVVTGSRVHVSDQAGTVVHYDDIAAASTVVVTQTVYGDSRDNWRIRVRKASDSPAYQPYETLMTATAGSSSLYIAQIQDE